MVRDAATDAEARADADGASSGDSSPPPPPARCEVDADCADAFPCTVDTCMDGACSFATDDSLCGERARCDLYRGCIADCGDVFCNLLPPACGCSGDDACYWAHGARVCAPAGTLGLLEPCAGSNACMPGLACVPVPDSMVGNFVCQQICTSDADCASGATCAGAMLEASGTRTCSHLCDVVSSAPCPTGLACRLMSDRVTTFCAAEGAGGQGDACTDTRECQAGFACGNDGSGGPMSCHRICEVASPSCPGGTSCRTLSPSLVVGGTELGICA